MPTRFRTPAPARCATPGAPRPRRFVSVVRGVLLLALILCAIAHGAEETHRPEHPPAPSTASAAGHPEPDAPHAPHGAKECAPDAIGRTATPAAELPLADAGVMAVLAAVPTAAAGPFARPGTHRRRRARTGRIALARTARWRI